MSNCFYWSRKNRVFFLDWLIDWLIDLLIDWLIRSPLCLSCYGPSSENSWNSRAVRYNKCTFIYIMYFNRYRICTLYQWCGSGSGRIRIHFGPWIRIQRYKITNKMKGKADINQLKSSYFSQEIIFFKSEPKKIRCWCLLTVTSLMFADGHLLTQLDTFFFYF